VMFERARPQVSGAIPRSKPVNLVIPEGAFRVTGAKARAVRRRNAL
jgi:cellulose synthase (UDP-forming)